MNEYWEVVDRWTGKVVAQCSEESDALMLCKFRPKERIYRKARFIMDQVIDITSTTDKQLPGQQGLPAAVDELNFVDFQQLPEGQGIPVNTK